MLTFLPAGLMGLVLASLASAYMSTMSSQLNWGSSYLVNDVYHRFIRPEATERELVLVGRLATVALMLIACTLALYLESAMQAFNILLTIGAGTGLLFLMRWFWWRINAFSEIAAMAVSFAVALYFEFFAAGDWNSYEKLIAGILITTIAWVSVSYLAPRTDDRTLETFYRLIRPGGAGWQRVRDQLANSPDPLPVPPPSDNIPRALLNVFLGCVGTYGALFTIGSILYGRQPLAITLAVVTISAFFLLYRGRYRAVAE